jgi:LAGLIDADG DNA endonuclease family protein
MARQYGDNVQGADNQQERLDGYIAGYVDGEGTFSITLSRAPTSLIGWQLIPEFHVSQNGDRSEVLRLIQARLGCGYIKPNGRKDRALVLVIRRRADLMDRVVPFFERVPLLSAKQREFECFARIVRAMDAGRHLAVDGFRELLILALAMNGQGRYRRIKWLELIELPESSETVRRTGAGALEDTVRAAWRHAESGRDDLAPEP